MRDDYKRPEDPDVLPFPPDAFVVAPANEGLCAGRPIIAVPTPNVTLARHPAFARSVEFLRKQGVRVLFDPDTYPLPTPNLGEAGRTLFPWDALKDEVVATLSP
ncbi:hypothetical protein AB0K60_25180 [Thermopolyspora sp. NPDC052614]|uniref:hypothetical protein n=1 Tax=Thermopolyspora sp. NPDC052614 TaxID=3155682 RepID=UPI00343EB627